jgi:hypothetical protein
VAAASAAAAACEGVTGSAAVVIWLMGSILNDLIF